MQFFIEDKIWKKICAVTLIDGAKIFCALITYKIHPKYNIFVNKNVKSTKRSHKNCKFSWKLGNRERTLSNRNLHGSITMRLKSWYSWRLRCKMCKHNAAQTQRRVISTSFRSRLKRKIRSTNTKTDIQRKNIVGSNFIF